MRNVILLMCLVFLASCGTPLEGDDGRNGKDGKNGEDATLELISIKKHNPSQFFPQTMSYSGVISIPGKLYITKGCGSNDGGSNKAAQLTIDSSIVCRYNPSSTVNKPCQSGNQNQIKDSKIYELVNCDLGYQADDVISVNSTLELNLSKADSSESEVHLKAFILEL